LNLNANTIHTILFNPACEIVEANLIFLILFKIELNIEKYKGKQFKGVKIK